jgi:hypothetical protein
VLGDPGGRDEPRRVVVGRDLRVVVGGVDRHGSLAAVRLGYGPDFQG